MSRSKPRGPTFIRDKVVTYILEHPGKFHSTNEIAAATGEEENRMAATLWHLTGKAVLSRRKRDGSKQYEYMEGPRIERAKKYLGHKFPFKHRRASKAAVEKVAAPVTRANVEPGVAGAGLVVKFNGAAYAITMAEARIIYDDLRTLFGE